MKLLITFSMSIFLSLAYVSHSLATEADEWGKEIDGVGVVIANNQGYITFKTNTQLACLYGKNVYWDISSDAGKTAYSTALAAKASNKKVRVVYSLPSPGGQCFLTHVYAYD